MRSVDWPKETERLLLRPGTADDAETLWRYWQLESVTHWLTRAPATFEVFRKQFDGDGLARWLVIEHEGVVIGDLMLRMMDPWSQAEVTEQAHDTQATLGWVLDPAWAGQGFATEAVRELVRICFEDLGLRRVTADCFALNEPSWRLMERVGMRREAHTVRDALHRSGEWLDGYAYALLADEWHP